MRRENALKPSSVPARRARLGIAGKLQVFGQLAGGRTHRLIFKAADCDPQKGYCPQMGLGPRAQG